MDSSRLRTGEVVAGIGGIALFVFLFFDWFGGGAEVSGSQLNGTITLSHPGISGWDSLTDLPGFLIILSGISGIALACLTVAGQRVNLPVRRGAVTAALGALAILLILWRMVAGSPTLKIGVFLGLAAAIAITVGALMALAGDGFQPLVAVAPASTTAVAAASAPRATPKPPPAAVASRPKTRSSGGSRSSGSTTRKRAKTGSTAKRSTAKKSGAAAKPSPAKKRSSPARTAKRSASTRSKATTAKKTKSSRSSTSKKSTAAKSRSSGGKRSSAGRKK